MEELLSVWLVPVKEDEDYLSNIIKDLAQKYDSPIFIPHLTLLGDTFIEFNKLKEILDLVFKDIHKFNIKKTKLSHSELFFKTIFIEFELDDNLKNLFLLLSKKTNGESNDNFKPHTSLIYKLMPKEEKVKEVKELHIKDEFRIGSVYINSAKNGEKDFLNVLGWQTLYKKSLK